VESLACPVFLSPLRSLPHSLFFLRSLSFTLSLLRSLFHALSFTLSVSRSLFYALSFTLSLLRSLCFTLSLSLVLSLPLAMKVAVTTAQQCLADAAASVAPPTPDSEETHSWLGDLSFLVDLQPHHQQPSGPAAIMQQQPSGAVAIMQRQGDQLSLFDSNALSLQDKDETHAHTILGLLVALMRTACEPTMPTGDWTLHVREQLLPELSWYLLIAPPPVLLAPTGHAWLRVLLQMIDLEKFKVDGGCLALRVLGVAALMQELADNVFCLGCDDVVKGFSASNDKEVYRSLRILRHPDEALPRSFRHWPGFDKTYGTGIMGELADAEAGLRSVRLATVEALAQAVLLLAGRRTPVGRVAQLFERLDNGDVVARPAAALLGSPDMVRHLIRLAEAAAAMAPTTPALKDVAQRANSVGLLLLNSGGQAAVDVAPPSAKRAHYQHLPLGTNVQEAMQSMGELVANDKSSLSGVPLVLANVRRSAGEPLPDTPALHNVPSVLLPSGNLGDGLGDDLANILRAMAIDSHLNLAIVLSTVMYPLRRMAQDALRRMACSQTRVPDCVAPTLLQNPIYAQELGGDALLLSEEIAALYDYCFSTNSELASSFNAVTCSDPRDDGEANTQDFDDPLLVPSCQQNVVCGAEAASVLAYSNFEST
jgi:hypothetical protein